MCVCVASLDPTNVTDKQVVRTVYGALNTQYFSATSTLKCVCSVHVCLSSGGLLAVLMGLWPVDVEWVWPVKHTAQVWLPYKKI